jgi:hypothetical protein
MHISTNVKALNSFKSAPLTLPLSPLGRGRGEGETEPNVKIVSVFVLLFFYSCRGVVFYKSLETLELFFENSINYQKCGATEYAKLY